MILKRHICKEQIYVHSKKDPLDILLPILQVTYNASTTYSIFILHFKLVAGYGRCKISQNFDDLTVNSTAVMYLPPLSSGELHLTVTCLTPISMHSGVGGASGAAAAQVYVTLSLNSL